MIHLFLLFPLSVVKEQWTDIAALWSPEVSIIWCLSEDLPTLPLLTQSLETLLSAFPPEREGGPRSPLPESEDGVYAAVPTCFRMGLPLGQLLERGTQQ